MHSSLLFSHVNRTIGLLWEGDFGSISHLHRFRFSFLPTVGVLHALEKRGDK
jgi:hypothetical protein